MILFLLVIVILIVLNIYAYLDMVKNRTRYYNLLNKSMNAKNRETKIILQAFIAQMELTNE